MITGISVLRQLRCLHGDLKQILMSLVICARELLGRPTRPAQLAVGAPQDRATRAAQNSVFHRRAVVDERTAFSDRPIALLKQYFAHALDKAGAYAIQEHGEWIVEEISGSFTNVVCLPLERVWEELSAWPKPG